jgi:STE24 endopeptidase
LRDRLETISRRIGLTYRRILIWESDGMMVNAAVVGLLAPVRYVLLSDGLLEMMDDRKIEAVFGHEAGHIKHRHMHFYLLFGILTMFVVGGTMLLADVAQQHWPGWLPHRRQFQDYLQVVAAAEIVGLWATFFGPISRRFEWQADLFGTRSVTPTAAECDRPCIVHGTAEVVNAEGAPPVCASAAFLFAEALHRIADLNGIPIDARSWLHSSIGNRKKLLYEYVYNPSAAARLGRAVLIIKAVLVVGTLIGVGVTTWLYWPG